MIAPNSRLVRQGLLKSPKKRKSVKDWWPGGLPTPYLATQYEVTESSGASTAFEALSWKEAKKKAREWIIEGDYPDLDETTWIDGLILREDGEQITITVRIDPTEPPCTPGSNHDWGREQVSGHGGGIISTRECRICGLEETVDTWATRPDTGEEGFRSVGYTWKEVRRS